MRGSRIITIFFDEPDKIKPLVFHGAVIKNGEIIVDMPVASVVVLAIHE